MPASIVRPRLVVALAVALVLALVLAGTVACTEQRPRAAGDSAVGARAQADPATLFRARLGRTWELARLGEQDLPPSRASAAPRSPGSHPGPGTRPTIRFTNESARALAPDSAMSSAGGWSFCNGYGTAYTVGPGDQLRFRGFHSTLVGCNGPDSLESRFFRALGATRRFALDSATLVLIAEDGSRLTFVTLRDSASSSRD